MLFSSAVSLISKPVKDLFAQVLVLSFSKQHKKCLYSCCTTVFFGAINQDRRKEFKHNFTLDSGNTVL